MVPSRRRRQLPALAVLILSAVTFVACSGDSGAQGGGHGSANEPSDWPTGGAWTPSPWTPTPGPSVPVMPGVSATCAAALVEHSRDPFVEAVVRACPTLEELLRADVLLGIGGASRWESLARFACASDATIPMCAGLPPTAAPPSALPESVVRARCTSARPKNVYAVTATVATRSTPLSDQAVRVLLVELRDLEGKVTREPALKDETFYEFETFIAGDRSQHPIVVDVIACIALRATELEHWYYAYDPTKLYPVHASDAIVWLADADTGRAVGKPWLVRPPASGSGDNTIYFGDGGPGQRAPNQGQILDSIDRFFGF